MGRRLVYALLSWRLIDALLRWRLVGVFLRRWLIVDFRRLRNDALLRNVAPGRHVARI